MSPFWSEAARFAWIGWARPSDPDGTPAGAGAGSRQTASPASLLVTALLGLAAASSSRTAQAACDPQFFCETLYPAGPSSHELVVGDFNADGIADIALANASGSVTVHLEVSSGGMFNHAANSPADVRPYNRGISMAEPEPGGDNGEACLSESTTCLFQDDLVLVLLGMAAEVEAVLEDRLGREAQLPEKGRDVAVVAPLVEEQVGDQLAPRVLDELAVDVDLVTFLELGVGPGFEMGLE